MPFNFTFYDWRLNFLAKLFVTILTQWMSILHDICIKDIYNIFPVAMALLDKSIFKIRSVSHFHVLQSCMSWAQDI